MRGTIYQMLAALFGMHMITAASAQPADVPNGTKFGDWQVVCEAATTQHSTCALAQRIMRRGDGAFLVELLALPRGAAAAALVARVPNGVHFPSGFALRAAGDDAAAEHRFAWQSCDAHVCEAVLPAPAAAIAEFEVAPDGMIGGYRPAPRAKPVLFRLSLSGLAEGLAALRAAAR